MEFKYDFNGWFFYEVEHERVVDGVLGLFAENYGIKKELVKSIYNDDWLKLDRLKEEFKQELWELFKGEAYLEYLNRRYA